VTLQELLDLLHGLLAGLDRPRHDPGLFTQEIQREILAQLGELRDTFHDERLRRSNNRKQQQKQQGGQGQQPLVPPAMELVMLRKQQEDVNRRIESFFKRNPDLAKPLSEMEQMIVERLSHQQGSVKDLWKTLMDALGIEPSPEEGE